MNYKHLTLSLLAISLTLFTACGGGGGSSKSIIGGIPDNYKIVKGKPTLELGATSDDTIKSYTWMIDDIVVSQKAQDTIDLDLAVGKHKICLTLVDDKDKTKTECKNMEVVASLLGKPTAVINVQNNTTEIKTACPITISASESRADQNGEIIKYEWFKNSKSFGDGKATQKFESNSTGDVNITVKVTDNEYNTNSKTKIIKILPHTSPTVKLTLINNLQQTIFSLETNQASNTIGIEGDNPTNKVHRGNLIFLSVDGSYDDCNLTDDNLTYVWDGRILIASTGEIRKQNCFSANPWLKDVHRDFNSTDEVESQAFAKRDDIVNKPNWVIVNEDKYNSAKYIYPYIGQPKGVGGPYVYFPTCSGHSYTQYDRLEIDLTVIDNLHHTQTYIRKTIKIYP